MKAIAPNGKILFVAQFRRYTWTVYQKWNRSEITSGRADGYGFPVSSKKDEVEKALRDFAHARGWLIEEED